MTTVILIVSLKYGVYPCCVIFKNRSTLNLNIPVTYTDTEEKKYLKSLHITSKYKHVDQLDFPK